MLKNVAKNIQIIKNRLGDNIDVAEKSFIIGGKTIGMVYLTSIVNSQYFADMIMSPILEFSGEEIDVNKLSTLIIKTAEVKVVKNSKDSEEVIVKEVLSGNVAIFVSAEDKTILVDIAQSPQRAPAEPPTSAVIYGPREGFTESAKVNLGMIRRRLETEKLVIKNMKIGKLTNTDVMLCYINGVANNRVVKNIEKKLQKINVDGVIDSHYILSFLQKDSGNFFKQAGIAEKPDIVSARMLEGRVAIIVDGSPIVLTLPFLIIEDIQSSNDYYTNPVYVTVIRVVRILGILIATVVPGTYLALRLYHYKILPLRFLISVANTTDALPFTPFVELLFILILFHILYEVSLRLPRYLGLATSIVGALILGETGVNAGLISPPGVIIIAMSIIAIYTVPDQAPQLTLLRLIFLIVGGTIGLLGIIGLMIYFINELAGLQKYNSPYLAPYAPRVKSDLKDGIFMRPISRMRHRPKSFCNGENNIRERELDEKQLRKKNEKGDVENSLKEVPKA